ncbi:thiol reductant ABC exporter subunit CydD [Cellulosimicrobium protaetiae]|uniref:Thiol reductant ABC exporter subunit CydD n=1 Tax=Cellulosimicrobium protaetiae TaxID=2587808 RepID=A0A6M5UDS4_9MICO|nr:thiol reductant ABC exporter subunit CydD [Cellulosimicrobium protaetiae]QJW36350.1 thiol reductant ABC exporter subunit CydD [Cellulosimicrobium protaetiae]
MKPLDPRLLRHARAARGYVVLTAVLGFATAALVVAQAIVLASVLAPAIQGTADLADLGPRVGLLAAVVAARAATSWAQERFALRAATRTVAELREQVVTHAVALGPRWLASGRGPEVATLATRGLDALEPYMVRYLPQLLLAATVTPATLAVVLGLDWVSAVVIAVTIPLVPVFMVLVGRLTAGTSERRLVVMQRLGAQVLDLLAGLPTLLAFGRARGPERRVRALGDANRRATMGTLRIAFLSGMVLELLTTLSVAVVAVGVGLRLVHGGMELEPALAVLVLAPEVYLPLRQVGLHFHASTDGIAAAEQAFAVLDEEAPEPGTVAAPSLAGATIALRGVSVRAGDRDVLAPARLDLTLRLGAAPGSTGLAPSGRVVALTGPSGSGKTTTALILLGLVRPDRGTVTLTPPGAEPVDLADLDPTTFWPQVAWLPQRPVLAPGRLRDVVAGGLPVGDADLDRAARTAGLDAVLATLPDGWDTEVGRGGVGLSVGQRQRVALAAALLDDPARVPLVVLDEPTAHLDARGEQVVLDAVRAFRDQGRTVVVVAHRTSLVRAADDVVEVRSAPSGASPAVPTDAAALASTVATSEGRLP